NAGFRLRAAPIASVTNTVARQTIDASGSIAAYGLRSLPSQTSIWPVLLEAEAAGLADAYVDAYQEPRPVFRLELLNATGALTREIAMREVSDLIHIVDPWSGIDHQVSVEQITHEIAGSIHRLTLLCEQFLAQDWAVWDSTALGDRWDAGTFGQ
ncbi:MAG TPA: hypothetical protein VFW27_35335, partial [Actinoplanes sp.]|nr:hypothetical protein [Actinoplanes sp.]